MTITPIQPVKETLDDLEQQLELVIEYLESDNTEQKAIASAIFEELEPLLENKIDGYVARINCL
ncbi:MAG TPA: hypothetical protein DCP31_14160, partial [Cyanobacteria bacterium UBA8543]|nr:hypothetical protein [Cyanobacteria bacterium UBA8543]